MTHPSLIRAGRSLHALGLAVMLALAVGPYVAAGLPLASQNASLRREIDKNRRLLKLETAVQARHDKLLVETADHERRRREVLERIPQTADEAHFLSQLTELATTSHLKLQHFRPGAVERKSTYSQMDISLDAAGTYEDVCRFIAGLETIPRFCRLSGLTIQRGEGDAENLRVSLTLRIFFNSTPSTPAA
jgi:Tfp pilus assembly protein PilO